MEHDWIVCDTLYDLADCIEIKKTCVKNIDENIIDGPAHNTVKTSEVKLLNYRHVKDALEPAHEFVLHINKNYFGLDIHNVCDGDVVLLNTYDSKNKASYEWHKDVAATTQLFDFKLTMLINLSDGNYEGGNLQIFTTGGEQTIDSFKQPGAVCIIPSWVPHRVTNVTSGVRTTLSYFYTGPKIR